MDPDIKYMAIKMKERIRLQNVKEYKDKFLKKICKKGNKRK